MYIFKTKILILYVLKYYSKKGSIAFNRLLKESMKSEGLSDSTVEGKGKIEFC